MHMYSAIKKTLVENSNLLEADQLAIHKAGRITDNKSIEWQGGWFEPGKSGAGKKKPIYVLTRVTGSVKKRWIKKKELRKGEGKEKTNSAQI